MNEPVNLCEDCGDCSVCFRAPEFLWSLVVTEALENGRKSFEFYLLDDKGEMLAEGSAHGVLSIFDLAREAIFDSGLVTQVGAPSSFTDIAFDSGRIAERSRAIAILRNELENWTKPAAFSYPAALENLIARLEEKN